MTGELVDTSVFSYPIYKEYSDVFLAITVQFE